MTTDYHGENVTLLIGDCLERMKEIPDGSVDMVMCDLPYGTTACKWDVVIPFAPLWAEYRRVCKKNAAIVLTASQPFTSALIMSNVEMFKYCLVWDKKKVTGFLNSKKRPLVQHEDICIFYKYQTTYNPQFHTNKLKRDFRGSLQNPHTENYGSQKQYISNVDPEKSYPRSIICQTGVIGNSLEKVKHPTQKPVALMEYLIRTYTNEGEIVLDNCMGSGTTGVACANTGRRFVGIERDETYFGLARERIEDAVRKSQEVLPLGV